MNRYYPAGVIFHNMILGLPSGEEACRVGDRVPPRDVKALGLEDSSFWRRKRLQGYLAIFTIMTNVVRELIGS